MPDKRYRFGIIGTGVVGTTLAILLERAGHTCIGVNTRSKRSYGQFFKYIPQNQLTLTQLTAECELLFITTQDCSIAKVANDLSREEIRNRQTWIHCSGSLRSAVLNINPSLPVDYLSMHPLQAFAKVENALNLFAGTHFGIEGSNAEAEAVGMELVRDLGGIPHQIDPGKKTLYHAGAVVASNYLVSLVFLAVSLFQQAGINKEDALESLLPLVYGSYQNIARVGLPCALTGPIARGDVSVIQKHLQEMPSDLSDIYKGLGRLALELGKERKELNKGSYDSGVIDLLENILRSDH